LWGFSPCKKNQNTTLPDFWGTFDGNTLLLLLFVVFFIAFTIVILYEQLDLHFIANMLPCRFLPRLGVANCIC